MAHQVVWGLDIGNSAVKAVKMERQGDSAVIVDFDIIDIYGGDEEADRNARVQAALRTLVSNHDIGSDPVYLSLPGDMCLFKEFQLPPGSENKLHELVMYEAKQQIPMLDQVELGWERYDDPTGTGVGVELIAVRKTIIGEILGLTDEVKLNVQGITVSPLALFNFIHFEFAPTGPTLVLDAGYKGTDFVVMHGRHIYSRTIPIAGREITRALENKFKVPFEKAEDLKKNISQSKQAEKILGVIEPTLRQLSAEIQRTIGFWKSKARGQKINQGYLLGHTFRLPSMAETMANQVREAPFSIVEGVNKLQLDRNINPQVFENEFPTMAVSIGLGLQGLGQSELKVNLLPKDRVLDIAVGKKRGWGAVAVAAILVAVVLNYVFAQRDYKNADEMKQKVETALKDVKNYEAKLREAENGKVDKNPKNSTEALSRAQQRLNRLTRYGRDRGRVLEAISAVANLKGKDNKPFWGAERKVYITNVYASRFPFGTTEGLKETSAELTGQRRSVLGSSNDLSGPNSLYKYFAKKADPLPLPPELRPDAPLIVVVSGDLETQDSLGVLQQLIDALTALPEVSEVRTADRKSGLTRRSYTANYDWDGQALANKPTNGQAEVKYSAFHASFRWQPQDDPDLEPKNIAAKAPAKKAGARSKAKTPARK